MSFSAFSRAARISIPACAVIIAGCDVFTEPEAESRRRDVPRLTGVPAGDAVFAVDISHWSGELAAGEVACWSDAGVRHVVPGTQNADIARQQLGMAVNAGMSVDAYVMLYWDYDIPSQVERALSIIADHPVGRLWLDAEQPAGSWSASQLVAKIRQAVDACGDFPCGIYTRKVWWRDNVGDSQAFSDLPIWYAYYDGQDDFDDWFAPLYWYEGPFGGWESPAGKQYDSDWTAPDLCGVNVDYNVIHVAVGSSAPLQLEFGRVTTAQSNRAAWHAVQLTRTYRDPVVIMGPPSFNGGQPAMARVRDVTPTGFEFQIGEWNYLDGAHATESLGYLVVEAGVHRLADGGLVQAGTSPVDHAFRAVSFAQPFAVTPVVLSQPQTANGGSPVVTRQRSTSATGFELQVQEEEAADGSHVIETVGYVAIAPATGGSLDGNAFEAGLTPDAVAGAWYPLSLAGSYADPILLAGIQTRDGGDPVAPRYRALPGSSVEILLQEETSADTETGHTTERVGYLVLENGTGPVDEPGPPSAPTGLSPSGGGTVTTSSVTLSVDAIADATGYEFEIEYLSGGVWHAYYTYGSTTTSKTFWPAYDNTAYRWRARANNAHGWGPWSDHARFDFGEVPTPPPAPAGLSPAGGVTIATSSVTMSCDPIGGAASYEFEVEYLSGGVWRTYYTYASADASQTFWPVYSGTSYRWRVRARNAHGWGARSDWARFTFSG